MDGWAAFGFPLGYGLALIVLGRCLLRLGDVSNAGARLRAGREVLEVLDAGPAVEEADRSLAEAGLTSAALSPER